MCTLHAEKILGSTNEMNHSSSVTNKTTVKSFTKWNRLQMARNSLQNRYSCLIFD
jgi:hypothetical protein